jgi:hypothetical protein
LDAAHNCTLFHNRFTFDRNNKPATTEVNLNLKLAFIWNSLTCPN